MTTRKTLLAVDGNSLIHRSFHALASSGLTTTDGRPTWAIKGFCNQLLGSMLRVGADGLVVGFDDHTTSVRKARWPHYKATRKPKPPELGQQLAMAAQMLRDAGVHVVIPDGLEADDVLASAAATAAAQGWNTVIVTSDRDSFALVDSTTNVLRLINGGVEASPMLNADRLHTLTGVHPHQYREYAAMRGDTSDNLAGIRGVGEKTAAKLLAEFGSVAAAMDDVDAGGERVATTLGKAAVAKLADADNREAFARNVEIMTVRTDLATGLDLAAGGAGCLPLDAGRLGAALDGLELTSVRDYATRVLTAASPQAAAPANAPDPIYDEPSYAPEIPPAPAAAPVVTVAAMAGSSTAHPTLWEDTLF